MNNVGVSKNESSSERSEELDSFRNVVKDIRKLPLTRVPLWNREGKQIGEALRVVIKKVSSLRSETLNTNAGSSSITTNKGLKPNGIERSEDSIWCPLGYLAGVRNSNHFYNSANRLQLTPDEACYIVDCLDNGRLP